MTEAIPDLNLFMACERLNRGALRPMPPGYSVRTLRREELAFWKAMQFDDPQTARENEPMMTKFYRDVYADKEDLFYKTCLMVVDDADRPVGSCFAWRAYGRIETIHWFKVLKEYEGRGIGRALFSIVMESVGEYPVYLHTQPASYRAIKLYTDFGFAFVTDPVVGYRENDLEECLPILERMMPPAAYKALRFAKAPQGFLEAAASSAVEEF